MEPATADSLVELLDQLHDIVEPAPVSLVPATWTWAFVAALGLAAVAGVAVVLLRRRRRSAYRRLALAELRALEPAVEAGEAAALGQLQTLLRRTALAAYPRAEVATLRDDAWRDFLDRTGGSFGPLASALEAAPYVTAPACDGRAAVTAVRRWINRHHA